MSRERVTLHHDEQVLFGRIGLLIETAHDLGDDDGIACRQRESVCIANDERQTAECGCGVVGECSRDTCNVGGTDTRVGLDSAPMESIGVAVAWPAMNATDHSGGGPPVVVTCAVGHVVQLPEKLPGPDGERVADPARPRRANRSTLGCRSSSVSVRGASAIVLSVYRGRISTASDGLPPTVKRAGPAMDAFQVVAAAC